MKFEYLNNNNKYDIAVVKKIFDGIEEKIKNNVAKFHNLIKQDNEELYESYQFLDLLPILESVKNEKWIFDENCKNKMYYGIGNIGIFYNGNPEIALYMALKALKTNNNIVFFENDDIRKSTSFIIDLINEECKKYNYEVVIKIEEYDKINNLCNEIQDFNIFMFINKKDEYLDFIARNKMDVKVLYSNFGTMHLYIDDTTLKDDLMKIDEFAYNNNIAINVYKDNNIEDAVKKINNNKYNYCSIIFTKDKKKALYFIQNIKAEKVYINKSPIYDYKFEISDEQLVCNKKIII